MKKVTCDVIIVHERECHIHFLCLVLSQSNAEKLGQVLSQSNAEKTRSRYEKIMCTIMYSLLVTEPIVII